MHVIALIAVGTLLSLAATTTVARQRKALVPVRIKRKSR